MAKARKLSPDTTPSTDIHPDDPDYRDRIAMRAYELYLARGASDGGDFDDWLAAERELSTVRRRTAHGNGGA